MSSLPFISTAPKRPFKSRISTGAPPKRKGGKLISAHKVAPSSWPKPPLSRPPLGRRVLCAAKRSPKPLPCRPAGKALKATPCTPKPAIFKPYSIPKLSRARPLPQASASAPLSPSSALPKVTSALVDRTWSLRNYDGVQCMVISLAVADCEVTVRSSEMIDGCKIPPPNDGRIRDWTKTTAFIDEYAALEFAQSTLASALDDDFTEGSCPNCGGPGRFTEAELSEKVGLLRAGIQDGGGKDAICKGCDRAAKLRDSLK